MYSGAELRQFMRMMWDVLDRVLEQKKIQQV
jgi:hypothetical protein